MASSATLPHLRPLSTAECYLTPLSATKASSLFLSLSSRRTKPIRCRPLSFSSPFRTSLRSRTSPSPLNLVALVAQTSDWAQQEQELQLGEEDLNWEAESQSLSPDFLGDGDTAEEGLEAGDEYPEPPEEAKLFVGNLSYDIDSNKLAEVFQAAGVVEICEVIFNRETGQSRGFGFVTMSTVEEAENAIGMFNRFEVNGRRLNVNKAAPRGTQPNYSPRALEPIFKLYVGNLPWQIDSARLEQVFSEHGKVVSARVAVERDSGRSRGFGFVTMSSEAELNDAMAALDGQDLDGRTIRVNVAEERQRRSF